MARVSGKKLIHLFHPFARPRTWNFKIIWEWLGCDTEIIFKNDESVFEKTDMYRNPGHTHLIGVWFPRCLEVSTRQRWRRWIPVLICAFFSAWVVRQNIYICCFRNTLFMVKRFQFYKKCLHGGLNDFFLFSRSDSIWLAPKMFWIIKLKPPIHHQ